MSDKEQQYLIKISGAIQEIFNEESENYIDPNDFLDEDNAKLFFHLLATAVPCRLWNKLTSNQDDILQFNHVCNQLVFEFATK